MKFVKFKIRNFKGITDAEINLKRGAGNVFTLIGLNESGKTTFLEAMSFLMEKSDEKQHKDMFGDSFVFLDDPTKLIPLKSFANFNSTISVKGFLSFSDGEKEDIINSLQDFYPGKKFEFNNDEIIIEKKLEFKDSNLKNQLYSWNMDLKIKNARAKTFKELDDSQEEWKKAINLIKERYMPTISYFPSFLFNFPKEIYIDSNQLQGQEKIINDYYKDILTDILYSTDPNANINVHILQRLQMDNDVEKRKAEHLLNQMGVSFSKDFLTRWDEIFKQQNTRDKTIVMGWGKTAKGVYISFKLKDGADDYFISERSLGFRWFFSFLLFTELKSHRKNQKNILFLLDEPASNLHASAQIEILNSFERTTSNNNNTIIFSTHSHYLINPNWLENAFICQNRSMTYDNATKIDDYSSNKADIAIIPYRQFVNEHPEKTTFFQPVLDVLEYKPCLLEYIPNAVIMEGKTDHYIINYFKDILFKDEKNSVFNIIPGNGGCSKQDEVIRLYLGWGRKFIVMLDGDTAGETALEYYKKEYLLSDSQIYKLTDVQSSFKKIESLVSVKDKEKYCLKNKNSIDNFFKENLATGKKVDLSEETTNNFKNLLDFLSAKMSC